MEFSLKNVLKKNWLAIVTILVTMGILIYFLITTDGIPALIAVADDIRVPWLLLMFAMVLSNWFLEGLGTHYIAKKIYSNWKLKNSIVIGMIGLLYGCITPFSSGGQPMQVYYMKKMGMDASKAAAIITVKTMVYQVVMVVFALVMVIWKLPYFQANTSNFWFVTLLGLGCNLIFISAVFFFSFNRKITNKLVSLLITFLSKIRLCKNPEKTREKILGAFNGYFESTRIIGKSFKVYLVAGVLQILQIIVVCLVPYFIYRSFGFNEASPVNMIAAQSFVTMVSAFVPLPGASGGAEGSFAIYFGVFFKNGTLMPSLLIWRIMTYYMTILAGAIFVGLAKLCKPMELKINPKLKSLNTNT